MGHIRPQPQIAMTRSYHTPVLLTDAVELLAVQPGKKYIDGTVGGGGHAAEIIKRGGILLGVDIDRESIDFARQRLGKNVTLVQGNFRDIERIAKENGFSEVDGVLLDLGVSSHQLDTPERGFSYRFGEAPLDLRLDQSKGETAAELIDRLNEDELYEILAKFGEVDRARELVGAIVRSRPIKIAGELLQIVGTKDAPQVFQALRIAVNDELAALKDGLAGSEKLIKRGGRIVVISFHSLEDRMVKWFMSDWKVITKKPIRGDKENNPRARSAKLRAAEKL